MNESDSPGEPSRLGAARRARKVARAVRKLPLSDYLIKAMLQVMPTGLTDETVRLFGRFISHCRQEAPLVDEHAIAAFSRALDSSELGIQVKARWIAAGGELSQLKKLIIMVAYRADVLRPNPWHVSGRDYEYSIVSPAELERFWSAGGHDLTELAGFLRDVDREGMDWLPL